jgi:hypothetical protein
MKLFSIFFLIVSLYSVKCLCQNIDKATLNKLANKHDSEQRVLGWLRIGALPCRT